MKIVYSVQSTTRFCDHLLRNKRCYHVDCKNFLILCSNSALMSSGTVALPLGVISSTSSSTEIFSNPFPRIISLQCS